MKVIVYLILLASLISCDNENVGGGPESDIGSPTSNPLPKPQTNQEDDSELSKQEVYRRKLVDNCLEKYFGWRESEFKNNSDLYATLTKSISRCNAEEKDKQRYIDSVLKENPYFFEVINYEENL